MRRFSGKIRAVIWLCVCIMALAGCGKEDGRAGEPEWDTSEEEESGEAEEKDLPEEKPEAETEDLPEERSETDEEALQAAQIRHYYGGVLSELTAAWQLPDMEIDISMLGGRYGEMRDNTFAVTDIDGDGREELIITYTNASMAGMFEAIYDYDPERGQLRQEFLGFPANTYYDNGIVIAQASHNHSRGMDFWPVDYYRYRADSDSYEWIGGAETWSKEWSETFDGDESRPFPEDLDVDGDGVLYNIHENLDADAWDYEKYRYNEADYEQWQQSVMGGAAELSIDREPVEYDSYADFTPAYLMMLAEQVNSGRTDTEGDLGLLILQDREEYFLDAARKLLTEKYGITIEQPYEDEDYTVGTLDGREIFSFINLNAGNLSYEGEKVEDVTIFGIYPGISADAAWEKLKPYGFYASPYGEAENVLITGEGFGNVSIWFSEEQGRVTAVSAMPYCAFAG